MADSVTDRRAELELGLSGRYVLERELGRGGMATVWLARDLKHERPVALKVLHPDLASSLGPERFQREIKLAARLQHPHILTVYDSGESGGQLWFTMPFIEGQSLRERLGQNQRLPLSEALRITSEAAQAIQYAHDHGIIHRDIKPENILLTRDGNTLVADFGVARPVEGDLAPHLTAAGYVVGTPSYMSPEQAAGDPRIDGRSDVYSLGCVLYEMLSGTRPFTGTTAHAIVAKQLTQPAPPIPSSTAVPESVRRAIATALAKSPEDRFASAAEFAAALAQAEQPAAGPLWNGRRVATAAVAACGVLTLIYYAAGPIASRARGAAGTSGALASTINRQLRQLTFSAALEEWPTWSPDGTRLAYVTEVDGFRQLFVRTIATGEDHRLTHGSRDDIQPAWSPDSRGLAFVRARTSSGKLDPADINGWYHEGGEIWAFDLASGKETKLIEEAFAPSFSPDGTRLAFDAPWAGPRRIWIADTSGRNPRQITSDSSDAVIHAEPRWSPDGTKLVFRRIENPKSDIVVVNLASGAMTRMTDDNLLDLDPIWSPDGRSIYFASSRGGGLNLWRVGIGPGGRPAGAPEQLTTGAGDDVEPAPAPDGRRLAFAVRGINSDMWRLPVSPESGKPTGQPEPVVATTRVESRGSWSPDGGTIAFNSDRLGEMNLWLHRLSNGAERQITTGPGGDYQPEWSPDAQRLVFFSARASNIDIWTVRLSDGRLDRLTESPSMDINPFYSPDGRRIAFLSDRSGRLEVWVMNADGSGQRRVTSIGARGHFLPWTPDGSAVLFPAESGPTVQIYRVNVADGALTRLPDMASGAHMSFSPGDSLVLDVRGHKKLWVYPLSGRPGYQIYEFPDPDIRIDYPVWSPDGKWILFDRAAPKGGDLWILAGI
jgi:eukaryotic-like serine/threonine-protein kinase